MPVVFSDVAVTVVRGRSAAPGRAREVRRAALALGANLGDRLAALRVAVDRLATAPGTRAVAVSSVFETDPVGGPDDQPAYLNAVVVVDTDRSAEELLALARAVEVELGRERSVRWGARTIDVDVLAVGAELVDTPELTVPHPRACERAFVLVPWAAVDPEFVVPGRGRVADLAAAVDPAGVRVRPELALELPA